MIRIDVSKFNNLDHALKGLKKKIRNTKVMEQLRENRYFIKPSATKRKSMIKAKYLNKKFLEE
jgi:small subunit ribosomal protein S21